MEVEKRIKINFSWLKCTLLGFFLQNCWYFDKFDYFSKNLCTFEHLKNNSETCFCIQYVELNFAGILNPFWVFLTRMQMKNMQNNNKMHEKYSNYKNKLEAEMLGVLPLDEVLKVNLSDMLLQP